MHEKIAYRKQLLYFSVNEIRIEYGDFPILADIKEWSLNYFLLMSAPQGGGEGGAGTMLVQFVPIILIFVIFYLLLIRPQQKKQKEHKQLLAALKKGDKVVTNSGMFGVISSINEEKNLVVLRVADDVKLEFMKSSIAGKVD